MQLVSPGEQQTQGQSLGKGKAMTRSARGVGKKLIVIF